MAFFKEAPENSVETASHIYGENYFEINDYIFKLTKLLNLKE